ncbi:acetylesterase [Enterococcus sp. JM4C]|uniref:alpha/beta hydrolase n=1 Tax=Candidatus Enterococcus huntleyi TaxID=1857217 RepID=UPI00137B28FC|nr:alpha/beta hydrolase [Enterococcus sp. JM4C]KAF1299505.1 acetylesterase [Enterococcus sp. JM4C]
MKHERIKLDDSTAYVDSYLLANSPEMIADRKRPLVVICPGGGYEMTSDREAEPVAIRFLGMGFHALILRYSVAPSRFPESLVQLAKTVQLARNNADEWGVDPDKIIVAGFSAGGHLAASLGVFWQKDFLKEYLEGENSQWQPNALLLSYPVISSGPFAHNGSFHSLLGDKYEELKDFASLETQVSENTPQTFLWHTVEDDAVPMENSIAFAQSLRKYKVPFELHLFPKGGHGLSLGTDATSISNGYGLQEEITVWPDLFETWVKHNL